MKYYLIAGEASGDLHASRLMQSLNNIDAEAEFRFFGGDLMAAVGGTRVKHYRELAYMGFIPVLLHLRTILSNMKMCKRDIMKWSPDAVILIDYPGFNLDIAKFVKSKMNVPVYYYISPKIWAWKEYRIKNIKRDVAEMFSILPFEVPFFEGKHHYPIHYVGNPTADEVAQFRESYTESFAEFCEANNLASEKPIIALLAGSRKQEINDNLPMMIDVASRFAADYQMVLACAPSIDDDYYAPFIEGKNVGIVKNKTYPLLAHSTVALVTSGTATLETALFDVPQVVCYKTPVNIVYKLIIKYIIKVEFISLVNLISNREIVKELYSERFTFDNIYNELKKLFPGNAARTEMLAAYKEVDERLGKESAPDNAARIMFELLSKRKQD